jgi:hypothetical protein
VETVLDVALTYIEAQVESTGGLIVLYQIVERWLDLVEYVLSLCSLLVVLLTDVPFNHIALKDLNLRLIA